MRALTSIMMLTGLVTAAQAHTLAASDGVVTALEHEIFGLHHLPVTLLLVVIGVVLSRSLRKKAD